MADRLIVSIGHRFEGGREIDAHIDCAATRGSMLVLFGPSAAGKTTVLRAIAGLLRPDRGRIVVGGATWFDASSDRWVAPQARRVGYVSQEPALFPHLTVRGNVAYGLNGNGRGDSDARTTAVMDRLGIVDVADRRARQLSGGQAQRVALARAVAVNPSVLLLDEPFNALDTSTRRHLRADVRALVRELGALGVLVTHDRFEAMAMGDAVAVMVNGRVRQVGAISDVFGRPADRESAEALGVETVVPAVVERDEGGLVAVRIGAAGLLGVADVKTSPGDPVFACVRAEDVVLERGAASSGSARNHLAGVVRAIEPEGPIERVTIDCGFPLVALVTRQSREQLGLAIASQIGAAIKATAIHIVPTV